MSGHITRKFSEAFRPTLLCTIIATALGIASGARATVLYSTGFEPPAYTAGPVNGQDGWFAASPAGGTIQTAIVKDGTQALHVDGGFGGVKRSDHLLLVPILGRSFTFAFDFKQTGDASFEGLAVAGDTGFIAQICQGADFSFVGNQDSLIGITGLTVGIWHHIELTLDFTALTMRGVTDGLPSGTLPINNAVLPTSLTTVSLFTQGQPSSANDVYFDNLVITTPAVPEPATISGLGLATIGMIARRRR